MALATAPDVPAITRNDKHEYSYGGETYPGVTGILKIIDKSGGLMAWAARNTAEAALAQLDNLASLRSTVGDEAVVKMLTSRSAWKRDSAASDGTVLHAQADRIVHGVAPAETEASLVARVTNMATWWRMSGWRLRLSEAYVVHPLEHYGGTFDLLAYDAEGRTVLADWKSGKWVYPETRLQLAAYACAQLVAPVGSAVVYPMPKVDRFVVLHVTNAGVRPIELDIGDQDIAAFTAALYLSQWRGAQPGWHL